MTEHVVPLIGQDLEELGKKQCRQERQDTRAEVPLSSESDDGTNNSYRGVVATRSALLSIE